MKSHWVSLMIVLYFLLISLIGTYPLVLHLVDSLPIQYAETLYENVNYVAGVMPDKYITDASFHIFYLWWWGKAVTELKNPLYPTYIYSGLGNFSVAYTSGNILDGIMSVPVYLVSKNPILNFNFMSILSFFLSGLFMYLFIHHMTKNRFAGLFAGTAFALAPYRITHYLAGELNLLTTFLMPISALFFYKMLEEKKIKYYILFGLSFGLQTLTGILNFYFSLIFISVCCLLSVVLNFKKIKQISIGIFFAIIFSAIFVLPTFLINREGIKNFDFSDVVKFSNIKLDVFVKKDLCPEGFPPYLMNGVCISGWYIPLILLILSPMSFLNRKYLDLKLAALVTALISFILALGHFSNISLYKIFWDHLPFFSFLREPTRFVFLTIFSLSILSAFSLDVIFKFVRNRIGKKYNFFVILFQFIILSILLTQVISIPQPLIKISMNNKVYNFIKNSEGNFTVLNYPPFSHAEVYNQPYTLAVTYHEKPMINGWTTFPFPNYERNLVNLKNISTDESADLIKQLNIRFILVHTGLSNDIPSSIYNELTKNNSVQINKNLRLELVEKDEGLLLYQVLR